MVGIINNTELDNNSPVIQFLNILKGTKLQNTGLQINFYEQVFAIQSIYQ